MDSKLLQSPIDHQLSQREQYEEDHRYDQYIHKLKEAGVRYSQKLQCAFFSLKNGLKYPGLVTKTPVHNNQVLVCLPIGILLTSQTAEKESLLASVYQQQFYHSGPIWQDRILITYLLFALSYKPDSIWSEMARNFSKDIDLLSFWEAQDLHKFLDKSVIHAASLQRDNFQKQWQSFKQIQGRHQQLQSAYFTYENYKWIYTHAVSRCFGAYLNSTYFVPYCQFFNHTCTDVSYECVKNDPLEKSSEIIKNEDKQRIEEKERDEESISSVSECSGDSEDYIEEGDFNYEEVGTYHINWCSKVSFNLVGKEKKKIEQQHKKIIAFLERNLLWKGLNLCYIGEIIQKANLIQNEYMAERKKFVQANEELDNLLFHANAFRQKIVKFYKNHGLSYKNRGQEVSTSLEKQQNLEQKQMHFSKQTEDGYKYFKMATHESFETLPAHRQIYFEYGRLSNRTLLLRYGFSLENNRYEHVWLRIPMSKTLSQYPDLFKKVQEKGLQIYYKLKIKPYVLSTQLITLFKLEEWKMYGNVKGESVSRDFEKIFGINDLNKQIQIIKRVIQIYQIQLEKYGIRQDLTDKTLSYHEYFIAVYHNEKIEILTKQITLLKTVIQIFQSYLNKQTYKALLFKYFPARSDRKMVHHYLKNLQSLISQ